MQSHVPPPWTQVQFDEREDTKVCTIVINDDQVFEGAESFHVELSMPVYALLGGNTRAAVNINDTEDEPTLQFDKKVYHVNESSGAVSVPIERKGEREASPPHCDWSSLVGTSAFDSYPSSRSNILPINTWIIAYTCSTIQAVWFSHLLNCCHGYDNIHRATVLLQTDSSLLNTGPLNERKCLHSNTETASGFTLGFHPFSPSCVKNKVLYII